MFKDFARVVRAADSEYDDSNLLRHRRELTQELDEEDKPRARSKVSSGRGKIRADCKFKRSKTFFLSSLELGNRVSLKRRFYI